MEKEPPLITIFCFVAIITLMILSVIIARNPRDESIQFEYESIQPSVVYQWEAPRLHFQTLGSLMGDNLLNEYMSMPEDQRGTIRCESTWRHLNKDGTVLRGKAGEWGICQFKWDTFELFKRQSKKTDLSIYSADDQIELMTWAFEQGDDYKKHWTCWRDLYENN